MKNKQIFTEEGLGNIIGFFGTLLKIDQRLKKGGYKFIDGKFILPKKKNIKGYFQKKS